MVIVKDLDNFNIKQICTCGQLFRYFIVDGNYVIIAGDKKIIIKEYQNRVEIDTDDDGNNDDADEFVKNYFDLNCDYKKIIESLQGEPFLDEAMEYGKGIRILKQNPLEMLISFIISANNNIPRIQKSLNIICEKFGQHKKDYYAFPTLNELAKITAEDFKSCGCGYRSGYLVDTIKQLNNGFDLKKMSELPSPELKRKLLTLLGVGPKVADCILLFGFYRTDSFPADVWVKRFYAENYGGKQDEDTNKVSKFFVDKFGNLSGFAQQYLYFYKREK